MMEIRKSLPVLTHLNVSDCSGLNDATIKAIKSPHLQVLDLSWR
jgi:hypothetical protein